MINWYITNYLKVNKPQYVKDQVVFKVIITYPVEFSVSQGPLFDLVVGLGFVDVDVEVSTAVVSWSF